MEYNQMDGAYTPTTCLVCTVPITSMHLGKDTCGACASFFKRSKSSSQQYLCRLGDLSCTTSKDGKFVCRRCRFDKCIAIGMEYEGLMRVRRKTSISILQRIGIELKSCVERQREEELKMIMEHGGHSRIPHPTDVQAHLDFAIYHCIGIQELYDVKQETMFEIYRTSVVEYYKFFKSAFPAFSELNCKDEHLIFKDYVAKLGMIEGYHRARQLWGGLRRYTMCSVMTCYDLDRDVGREDLEKCANAETLLCYVRKVSEEQNEVFLPIYNKCSLTDPEYHALVTLVMSELDSDIGLSEEAQKILDNYRIEVLNDLERYYKHDLGLTDFSTRIGNLMSLNHAIQECKSLLKVFFSFYATLFDVFITDNLIKELFLFPIECLKISRTSINDDLLR